MAGDGDNVALVAAVVDALPMGTPYSDGSTPEEVARRILDALGMKPVVVTFWDLRSPDDGTILSFSSREMSERLAIERLRDWHGTVPHARICTRTQTYYATHPEWSEPEPYEGAHSGSYAEPT